jgi:predicted DNA-binding transcriptional regulator YafY
MENLELLSRSFKRPRDFEPEYRRDDRLGNIIVRVLFEPQITRWVRESRPFYAIAEEETAEGLLMTLRVRQESEILSWLLSWGRRARVLEPDTLRQRLGEEARSVLEYYQNME